MTPELCLLTAVDLAGRIRSREVSCREVLDAHLTQIARVNPKVNAIITLDEEGARRKAAALDERLARGDDPGPLTGLPVAHKDLLLTKGMRTTFGSPLYRDHVPDQDALMVERIKGSGAVTIGKTNTPEFGAGSQTFNPVFGATANPYDLTKTCGGSSGGAAVALACRMLPIADGSDTGGSLRNPASFCNVVGFRTSPGRVPVWPTDVAWFPISVQGPMARTVQDTALLLSAIAGPDPRSPIALSESGERYRQPLDRDFQGVRIAWTDDFGELPVEPAVTAALQEKRGAFESIGCVVEQDQPDFRDADEAFKVWRAWKFQLRFSELIETHRDQLKDTILWNVEEGAKLTGPRLARAEQKRTALYHRVREFLQHYEYLIAPVSQVPPFDITQPYVEEIAGKELQTYIDWMKSCYYITVTGLPAISVPCGFTPDGLPVGVQIIGRHQDDWGVLQLAHAFEQATKTGQTLPEMLGQS